MSDGHEWKDAVKVVPENILNDLAKVACRQMPCQGNKEGSCAWCNDLAENIIGEYLMRTK